MDGHTEGDPRAQLSSSSAMQPHSASSCDPCIFLGTSAGCRRDACPFCHVHLFRMEVNPERPGKQIRMRLKRTLNTILQLRENSPDRVHDELQRLARRSGFARNLITGLLEREGDPDEEVQGGNTTTSPSTDGVHHQPVPGVCILDDGFDFDAFLKGEPLSL
ncbi:rnf12-b [Symbiodinium necroappetens]|uniref:Rnf12-b protein n=1 Tax=Symbiodinium necroappetens TaxID=1628268 RepID=A0A812IUG0_9DINO|nr:rnf12-b [Symbiodinium necroappetens]